MKKNKYVALSRRLVLATVVLYLMVLGISCTGVFNLDHGDQDEHDATPPRYIYVDAGIEVPGDGTTVETAFKHISDAFDQILEPGTVISVSPGTYAEKLYFDQSGAEIVPMTTGVEITGARTIKFPDSVDLSLLDETTSIGQYQIYIARSLFANNGVYEISAVDRANNTITINTDSLRSEKGVDVDEFSLSAAIGQPIVIQNADPESGRVNVDVSSLTDISTVLYIGDGWSDPCGADGPVSFVTFDGIDLAGSLTGGGLHIQSASFVTIRNASISKMGGALGIYVNGNKTLPARYNFLIDNHIFDVTGEAVYIGAGDQGEDCNYTQFTHVLGNTMTHCNDYWMENAIEVKEYHNIGTVIEGNLIHDFPLNMFWNGAINLQWGADHTLIYNNTLRDVVPGYDDEPIYIIGVDAGGEPGDYVTKDVRVFNNLIYNTSTDITEKFYAFGLRGDHTEGVSISNNTVYHTNGGVYLHYDAGDGGDNGVSICNNVFSIQPGYMPIEEADWSSAKGSFSMENNWYSIAPGGDYSVPAAWVGDPCFTNPTVDFTPNQNSPLLDLSLQPGAVVYDLAMKTRTGIADLGAFER